MNSEDAHSLLAAWTPRLSSDTVSLIDVLVDTLSPTPAHRALPWILCAPVLGQRLAHG